MLHCLLSKPHSYVVVYSVGYGIVCVWGGGGGVVTWSLCKQGEMIAVAEHIGLKMVFLSEFLQNSILWGGMPPALQDYVLSLLCCAYFTYRSPTHERC